MDGQGTTWRRNITENFNRLSRVHQRYRRQTDDRRQTDRRWHIANMNLSSRSLKTHQCCINRSSIQFDCSAANIIYTVTVTCRCADRYGVSVGKVRIISASTSALYHLEHFAHLQTRTSAFYPFTCVKRLLAKTVIMFLIIYLWLRHRGVA